MGEVAMRRLFTHLAVLPLPRVVARASPLDLPRFVVNGCRPAVRPPRVAPALVGVRRPVVELREGRAAEADERPTYELSDALYVVHGQTILLQNCS